MNQTIRMLAFILFTAYSLTGCGGLPVPVMPTQTPFATDTPYPTYTPNPTDTPFPTLTLETVAPSEIPQLTPPTNTNTPEPPSVKITYPLDNGTLRCDERAANSSCLFHVEGMVRWIDFASVFNYTVYVFVSPLKPHGEGWYLQK